MDVFVNRLSFFFSPHSNGKKERNHGINRDQHFDSPKMRVGGQIYVYRMRTMKVRGGGGPVMICVCSSFLRKNCLCEKRGIRHVKKKRKKEREVGALFGAAMKKRRSEMKHTVNFTLLLFTLKPRCRIT